MKAPVYLFGRRIPFLAYNISISDPAGMAALLQSGLFGLGDYGTYEALKFAAFYRGCALIAGTIASLPLRTYRTDPDGDGEKLRSSSFLDTKPSGPYGLTPFAWKELVAFNVVSQGECGLLPVYKTGGELCGFWPIPRSQYTVTVKGASRFYRVNMGGGKFEDHSDEDFVQILGLSLDGVRGISPVSLFQRGIQLSAAQEIASMRQATSGMKVAGLVAPKDEDLSVDDAQAIQADINAKMLGPDKAGAMIMTNRRLAFTKWDQTNDEAQFLELRRYAREEAALMLGLPIYMLEPSKQTSWGTGIAEQNIGLQRFTFMPVTSRIEEAISAFINPSTKYVEWDYKGLLQGTPEVEVKLILMQLDAGIMSEEEARDLLGLGPKEASDTFREPVPASPSGKLPLEPSITKPVETNVATSNGKTASKMG